MQQEGQITFVNTISERLKWAREQRGMTQEGLAERAGVAQTTIANIEAGTRKRPHSIVAIAAALGANPIWLSQGAGEWSAQGERSVVDRSMAEDAGRPRIHRPVPIVGTAKMGESGYFEELQHPTGHGDGWVDGYSADPNAYALRVKGDSMHPAIRHGSFVVVEPNGTCVPGEYVAIALLDGRKMVKELVIQRSTEIVVESVNGNHRQTIDLAEVEHMHPVAAVVAASKWRPE